MGRRWVYGLIGLGVLTLALAWGAFVVLEGRRFQRELDRATGEMAAARFGPARDRLARLSARRPGRAEVEFRLGFCEEKLRHADAALAAWARVPAGTPFSAWSAVARAVTLIEQRGRFSEGEALLEPVLRERGPAAGEASQALARLYYREGRFEDVQRLHRDRWPREPDRAAALREMWMIDTGGFPIERIKTFLEGAARAAPDDDRVWLGRANLAARSGHIEDAARLLEACLRRRPDDPVAWHARLNWALAAGRPADAAEALRHLPPGQIEPAEALRLRAWFAAQRGDTRAEKAALERRLALEPGDSQALVRLVALAHDAGQAEQVARLNRHKSEIDRAKDRYRELLANRAELSQFEELARLAETLGRRFEARGWWTLMAPGRPGDPARRAETRPRRGGRP
jgi:thioredoxin-like negative regulator of GroEL